MKFSNLLPALCAFALGASCLTLRAQDNAAQAAARAAIIKQMAEADGWTATNIIVTSAPAQKAVVAPAAPVYGWGSATYNAATNSQDAKAKAKADKAAADARAKQEAADLKAKKEADQKLADQQAKEAKAAAAQAAAKAKAEKAAADAKAKQEAADLKAKKEADQKLADQQAKEAKAAAAAKAKQESADKKLAEQQAKTETKTTQPAAMSEADKQTEAEKAALIAAMAERQANETSAQGISQNTTNMPAAKANKEKKQKSAPVSQTTAAAAGQPAGTADANYTGKNLGMKPLPAPPLPISASKQQELQDLLVKYRADQVSPDEYQKQRAAILAKP